MGVKEPKASRGGDYPREDAPRKRPPRWGGTPPSRLPSGSTLPQAAVDALAKDALLHFLGATLLEAVPVPSRPGRTSAAYAAWEARDAGRSTYSYGSHLLVVHANGEASLEFGHYGILSRAGAVQRTRDRAREAGGA